MTTPKLTGNRCQCPTCGEYFNGVAPFDHHRVGSYAKPDQPNSRRCLSLAEMVAAGFIRNAAGFWCDRADPEHAMRPRAQGISAPRRHRAMGQPSPEPDGLEMRYAQAVAA